MLYNICLFIHIVAVVCMFIAVGFTLAGMIGMVCSIENKILRVWAKLTVKADEFLPFSVILILAPALIMTWSSWGWKIPWLDVSLVALLIMTAAGPTINLPRFKRISKQVESETEITPSFELRNLITDKTLWNSVSIMVMEVLAIVFLMTIKPGFIGSVITVIAGIVLGLAVSTIALNKVDKTSETISEAKASEL